MLQRIVEAIRAAEVSGRALDVHGLEGLSGDRLIGCLQRLANVGGPDRCYVEVGVYRGLTLVSVAASARETSVFGIDDFSQVDPERMNQRVVEARIAANALTNATLINADFEDALSRLDAHIGKRRVGTYFVDGPHDYRSQLMCLELMRPYLAEHAAIVVDDSNYPHVRQATRDFLVLHPEYKLLFEAYTRSHPNHMSAHEVAEARRGWWNGVNVIVHDPEDRLARSLPPVAKNRRRFLNDHIVHSSRLASHADVAIEALALLYEGHPLRTTSRLARLGRLLRNDLPRAEFTSANTFSSELPARRFNPHLDE
jgi:hypothetical protein